MEALVAFCIVVIIFLTVIATWRYYENKRLKQDYSILQKEFENIFKLNNTLITYKPPSNFTPINPDIAKLPKGLVPTED